MSALKNHTFGLLAVIQIRAIFVWPWNEKVRTKQKQQTNGNRGIWLVYRTDTNAQVKKLHARELSRNQSIPHFDVILQHDWPVEQCLLLISVFFGSTVFFGGKTKSPRFDLFVHCLISCRAGAWLYRIFPDFLNSGLKMASKIEGKAKVIANSWNDIKSQITPES